MVRLLRYLGGLWWSSAPGGHSGKIWWKDESGAYHVLSHGSGCLCLVYAYLPEGGAQGYSLALSQFYHLRILDQLNHPSLLRAGCGVDLSHC